MDVRLNNTSQLSGFAKQNDLQYFLRQISGIGFVHMPLLAPTKQILDDYKKRKGEWAVYERQFEALMKSRSVETAMDGELRDNDCLLCSEHEPTQCHRRLVVEYLGRHFTGLLVTHL